MGASPQGRRKSKDNGRRSKSFRCHAVQRVHARLPHQRTRRRTPSRQNSRIFQRHAEIYGELIFFFFFFFQIDFLIYLIYFLGLEKRKNCSSLQSEELCCGNHSRRSGLLLEQSEQCFEKYRR